jgi:hypothetical protein
MQRQIASGRKRIAFETGAKSQEQFGPVYETMVLGRESVSQLMKVVQLNRSIRAYTLATKFSILQRQNPRTKDNSHNHQNHS